MNLLIPISLSCLMVFLIYLAEKHTPFAKLPYAVRQVIIGILFGGVSAFASSYGVEMLGTVINVRDAAPLSAGLIFGGPAGILAGCIGGLYRWFSVLWGGGLYTRLACTLGTILAGLLAAGLRKYMFDNKKPTWIYGICITVVCEVVHMLLIFLTNMDDSAYAFEFVKGATVPMLIGNVLAVGLSLVVVSLLSHERLIHKKGSERIAQTFQRWLLVCIVVAYLVTSIFTFILQSGMAGIEIEGTFDTALSDAQKDVREKSDAALLEITRAISAEYQANPNQSLVELSVRFDVTELNIVAQDGMIIRSTNSDYINRFNMNSTEQSKAFMVLTQGEQEVVQEYGPIGRDDKTMRKYAGCALDEGGFIQVGYDAARFHDKLDDFVVDVTKNRSVGSGGFIAVCNEKLQLVTEQDHEMYGKDLSEIGIVPDEGMLAGKLADELMETEIFSAEGEATEYIYTYLFTEGYCIIAAMPKDEAMMMRDASIYNSIFMQVLIFATLFVFIYVLIKRVIINNIQKINATLGQITDGNLNLTVDVRTNTEFASLSDDINSTVATLKRYIAEAAARIDRELEYAKQIQQAALPTNYPKGDSYGIYAQMLAAKEVGGDFYDFYKLGDDEVAFLVADVSGKGIPAAMFMMTAKTIIQDLAESGASVDEIFTRANEKLCEGNESGMFVTAWMGILEVSTGRLRFANAGHNPPLLKRADGSFEYLRTRAGLVLAGMEGIRYRAGETTLAAGDRIFLYTDGVTEATDVAEQLYGEARLLDFMNRNATLEATEILPALKADIDAFVGEAPQFDDMTMLMFDYNPKTGGACMTQKTFPAKVEALDDVIAFLEEALESYDCSMKNSMALCVAIEEVFVNVAHYAYGDGEGDATLELSMDNASRVLTLRLSDSGAPFDPLAKPDPDITLSATDRDIGGLGILITKRTMDEIFYAYENGENVLTMRKKI